jgi:hypothetical protein
MRLLLLVVLVMCLHMASALRISEYQSEPPVDTLLANGVRQMSHTIKATTKEGKYIDYKMAAEIDTNRFNLVDLHLFREPKHIFVERSEDPNLHHVHIANASDLHKHLLRESGETSSSRVGSDNRSAIILFGKSGNNIPILHRLERRTIESMVMHQKGAGTVLSLQTTPMEYHEVFRKASIRLATDHLVYNYVPTTDTVIKKQQQPHRALHPQQALQVDAADLQGGGGLGWSWDPLSDIVQAAHVAVSGFSTVVHDVISPIYDGLVALVTGSFSGSDSLELLMLTLRPQVHRRGPPLLGVHMTLLDLRSPMVILLLPRMQTSAFHCFVKLRLRTTPLSV